MRDAKSQEAATLLDVLIDGFEKNEVWRGFHWRSLPMSDEESAIRKFAKPLGRGTTLERRADARGARPEPADRISRDAKPCGVMVRAKGAWFEALGGTTPRPTWKDDPMKSVSAARRGIRVAK